MEAKCQTASRLDICPAIRATDCRARRSRIFTAPSRRSGRSIAGTSRGQRRPGARCWRSRKATSRISASASSATAISCPTTAAILWAPRSSCSSTTAPRRTSLSPTSRRTRPASISASKSTAGRTALASAPPIIAARVCSSSCAPDPRPARPNSSAQHLHAHEFVLRILRRQLHLPRPDPLRRRRRQYRHGAIARTAGPRGGGHVLEQRAVCKKWRV